MYPITKSLILAFLGIVLILWHGQNPCGAETNAHKNYSLSSLQPQQGRYFRWSAPPGWRVSESNAGVTLTSPDGACSASLATVLRSKGSRTPSAFLQWVFASVPGYSHARIVSVKSLPDQRMSYQVWKFIEAKVSYRNHGLPVTGVYKAGVANYAGMNDAMIVGYGAADASFQEAEPFMAHIARSIVLTNAAEANGNNTLVKPKNNPLDNSAIIQAGQNRQKGIDRAMERDAQARRGTVDLYDPSTHEKMNVWSQHKNYYWRQPGSNEVVGTDTYNPPGVGYVPLTQK
jgi:hypothetical protein